jgi:hypothetical protein
MEQKNYCSMDFHLCFTLKEGKYVYPVLVIEAIVSYIVQSKVNSVVFKALNLIILSASGVNLQSAFF